MICIGNRTHKVIEFKAQRPRAGAPTPLRGGGRAKEEGHPSREALLVSPLLC